MFGILGAVIYGVAYTIGWSQDEQREQHARKYAKQIGLPFYVDKRGRQRWTATGKKRTPQEILKEKEDLRKRNEVNGDCWIAEQILKKYRECYEGALVLYEGELSFEEYVAVKVPDRFSKYETIAKIKASIPKERVEEIKNSRLF